MFVIAGICFYRAKKSEQERISFAPTSGDDMKKRYRNGVEVKPSEAAKKVRTALNDSVAQEEDNEE